MNRLVGESIDLHWRSSMDHFLPMKFINWWLKSSIETILWNISSFISLLIFGNVSFLLRSPSSQILDSPFIISFFLFSSFLTQRSRRDDQFHLFNHNDQFNLHSSSSLNNFTVPQIEWKIFRHLPNGSWTINDDLTDQTTSFFWGLNEKNLTITRDFFSKYSSILYWRFEVIYSFVGVKKKLWAEFFIEMNVCPQNGSCRMFPSNGNLFTQFQIECLHWIDEHKIKDYLLLSRSSSNDDRLVLSSSSNGSFRTLLPATLNRSEEIFLSMIIRDEFHCSTEYFFDQSVKISAEMFDVDRLLNLSLSMINDGSLIHSSLHLIDQIDEEFLFQWSLNSSLSHFIVAQLDYHPPRTLVRLAERRESERRLFRFRCWISRWFDGKDLFNSVKNSWKRSPIDRWMSPIFDWIRRFFRIWHVELIKSLLEHRSVHP